MTDLELEMVLETLKMEELEWRAREDQELLDIEMADWYETHMEELDC